MGKAWPWKQPSSHWASLKHQRLSSDLQLTVARSQWQLSTGGGPEHPTYLLCSSEKNSCWLNTELKQLLSLQIFSEAMKGETAADFCLDHAENHQFRNLSHALPRAVFWAVFKGIVWAQLKLGTLTLMQVTKTIKPGTPLHWVSERKSFALILVFRLTDSS